jgi:hypothetical protein
MMKVPIRSRNGNVFLAIVGAIYVLAALVPLVSLLREAWQSQALVDTALLFFLTAAAAGGVWFIAVGLNNLGVSSGSFRRWRHH